MSKKYLQLPGIFLKNIKNQCVQLLFGDILHYSYFIEIYSDSSFLLEHLKTQTVPIHIHRTFNQPPHAHTWLAIERDQNSYFPQVWYQCLWKEFSTNQERNNAHIRVFTLFKWTVLRRRWLLRRTQAYSPTAHCLCAALRAHRPEAAVPSPCVWPLDPPLPPLPFPSGNHCTGVYVHEFLLLRLSVLLAFCCRFLSHISRIMWPERALRPSDRFSDRPVNHTGPTQTLSGTLAGIIGEEDFPYTWISRIDALENVTIFAYIIGRAWLTIKLAQEENRKKRFLMPGVQSLDPSMPGVS